MIVLITSLVMALTSLAAPQSSPPGLDAFSKRGTAAREAHRLEDAADIYREAVRLHPKWTEGHWYLGTISYELGRYPTCQTELQEVVRVQTKNGAAWAFKGLCEFQLKKYSIALDSLTKARRLGVGEDNEFLAVVGYHRAILLTRDGQFERALEELTGFVRGGNTGAMISEALGTAMLRRPMLPEALSPADRDMVRLAGQAAIFGMGRMKDEAEQAFADLVKRYPDTANVHYVYGRYLVRDRPDEALEQFKRELTISPDHALARLEIAQELIRRGEIDEAVPYAQQAARLAPRNFIARRVLGQVKLEKGDVAGAIVDLEAAVKLEPQSPSCHFNLAKAYQRAGRQADADRERAEFSRIEKLLRVQRGGANAVGDEAPEPAPQ